MNESIVSDKSNETSNPNSHFDVRELSLRLQKNLIGKITSRSVVKHFVTDSSAEILDYVYRILKDFYCKKDAEKVIKNILKLTMKMGLLIRNDQLNPAEMQQLNSFQQKLRRLLITIVSFRQVEYSYDRQFLSSLIEQCQSALSPLIGKHLSEKSTSRFKHIIQHVGNSKLLDALFSPQGKYADSVSKICIEASKLVESGEL